MDTDTPTRGDLERLEELRDGLTGDLEQAEAESRRLAQEARAATREGEDATDLIDGQVRAASKVATYRGALSDLRQEIEEMQRAVLQAEAEERLRVGLVRAAGSVAHELREDGEKIERLEQELEHARGLKRTHTIRLEGLAFEARVIAARFGLPEPPLTRGTSAPAMLDGAFRIEVLDEDRVRVVGTRGRERKKVLQGETGRLLAAGGPWERSREQVQGEQKAINTRKAEELRAACDQVDGWLRDFLAEAPAVRDRVFAEAEAAGFPIHPSPKHRGASLLEARGRLEILPLETRDGSGVAFWARPDVPFDETAFRIYAGESARSRQMANALR